jgi:transcriptional regulator with XRE-family HTH domain
MGRSRSSDIDRFLGFRIKEMRILACLSQQQMARQLGISSQQMHKFETGINRVSAAQLLAIARALDVTVADLFEGYDSGCAQLSPFVDPTTSRMLRNVTRSFLDLGPKQQDALIRLAQALATEH